MNNAIDGTDTAAAADADWALIVSWVHYSGENRKGAPADFLRLIDHAAWTHQDGYGKPGVTPPQGWDWSGIRDSSPAAVANMAAAIRRILKNVPASR